MVLVFYVLKVFHTIFPTGHIFPTYEIYILWRKSHKLYDIFLGSTCLKFQREISFDYDGMLSSVRSSRLLDRILNTFSLGKHISLVTIYFGFLKPLIHIKWMVILFVQFYVQFLYFLWLNFFGWKRKKTFKARIWLVKY